MDHHVKTAAKLNTTTLFTPNSKTLKRKSSVLAEETFLTQQRLKHELRIKKLKLEIEYTREEHVAKMRRLTKDLNEPVAAHWMMGMSKSGAKSVWWSFTFFAARYIYSCLFYFLSTYAYGLLFMLVVFRSFFYLVLFFKISVQIIKFLH